MRKTINKEHVEGYIQEHSLEIKTVQNTESANYGKEFIRGSLDIATSDDGMNVVTVDFTYVQPTWPAKNGKPERTNDTYVALKKIIDEGKTVVVDGIENATKVRIDTSLATNSFYTNRNGEEQLVEAKKNDGGFVHIVTGALAEEKARNTFEVDMLITGTKLVEADEEKHISEDYLEISGYVFNFRNDIQPVVLTCHNPGGINYFESLEASKSNPTFTKVWGNITSTNIVSQTTEESAWGEPVIKEYTRKKKEWVITGTAKEPYELGDSEVGITGQELKDAEAARATLLAAEKERHDQYQAQKAAGNVGGVAVSAKPSTSGFDF